MQSKEKLHLWWRDSITLTLGVGLSFHIAPTSTHYYLHCFLHYQLITHSSFTFFCIHIHRNIYSIIPTCLPFLCDSLNLLLWFPFLSLVLPPFWISVASPWIISEQFFLPQALTQFVLIEMRVYIIFNIHSILNSHIFFPFMNTLFGCPFSIRLFFFYYYKAMPGNYSY